MNPYENFSERNALIAKKMRSVTPEEFAKIVFANQRIIIVDESLSRRYGCIANDLCNYRDQSHYAHLGIYKDDHPVTENLEALPAIVIDIDSVSKEETIALLQIISEDKFPCTYLVSTGRGIHIYIVFDKPIFIRKELTEKMTGLTTDYIANIKSELKDRLHNLTGLIPDNCGIVHPYRLPGTQIKTEISKFAKSGEAKAIAYTFNEKRYTIRMLKRYIKDSQRNVKYKGHTLKCSINKTYSDPDSQLCNVSRKMPLFVLNGFAKSIKNNGIKKGFRNTSFLALGSLTVKAKIKYEDSLKYLDEIWKLHFDKSDFKIEEARRAFINGRQLIKTTPEMLRKYLGQNSASVRRKRPNTKKKEVITKLRSYFADNPEETHKPNILEIRRATGIHRNTIKKYILDHNLYNLW